MYKYFYDLHIHSCLSPCGDNDMTPNNIVNMAMLKNLNIIAISDHNTTKNCCAVLQAAKNNELDIIVVPAVEITTSEEIHVLVYFPDCDTAETFENEILKKNRVLIKNNPVIFGEQLILNEFDEKIGEDENLLINATNLSVEDVFNIAPKYNSVAVCAHIDKDANGIIAILGDYPENLKNFTAEIKNSDKINDIINKYNLNGKIISSSDAHYLWDILENGDINSENANSTNFIKCENKINNPKDLIDYLK